MGTTASTDTIHTGPDAVVVDLYRDIHKGIRGELFAITLDAGSTDPGDRVAKWDLARHVADLADLLERHAAHEDAAVQPLVEAHLPELAERIAVDHLDFEARAAGLVEQATTVVDAVDEPARRWMHGLYLDLAAFTSTYLAHQDYEERVIMPQLELALGPDAVLDVHRQIVGAIPPDVMARCLAVMLPAMNVEDRAELLGGMQAEAPAPAFAEVWGLAGSVLRTPDVAQLAGRLGL